MCVVIQNCSEPSFIERVAQLRRRSAVPRCLFGPPDPEETERMFQELLKSNRERMMTKYGVDVDQHGADTGPEVVLAVVKQEAENTECEVRESRIPTGEDAPSVEKDRFRPIEVQRKPRSHPYSRQSQLTDFWRCRRHHTDDVSKNVSTLPATLLSVPRIEEERGRI